MQNPIKFLDCKSWISAFLIVCFIFTGLNLPLAQAQDYRLPAPGVMVRLSPPLDPPILKGIKVHPDNPFRFDFILDQGDRVIARSEATKQSQQERLKEEATKLIKYFLASLTIPEKDLWVNLSPYEKDRIIPNSFGLTEMGRDLLAEDYMLKQITASLIYPEDQTGKKFWKSIYEQAEKKFGRTNIPVNTFNKVWIVPQKAVVYENAKAGTAYVVESKLKVMLEQDYLALEKNAVILSITKDHNKINSFRDSSATPQNDVSTLGSQIIREIVIPELTKEVNEDKNFARLRQVYNSLILATWYKKKIRDSILSQVYADKNKVAGVNIDDPKEKERIYQKYLMAFKKGAFNLIREEVDPLTQENIPRKYFSGGLELGLALEGEHNTHLRPILETTSDANEAMQTEQGVEGHEVVVEAGVNVSQNLTGLNEDQKIESKRAENFVMGLIGVGRQGKRHLRHLAEQNVETLATDSYMGEDVYENFGKNEKIHLEKAEADRVLNDPTVKAVIIATPGNTHFALVKRALAAGKHVLVEKPFTTTTDEANELVAMAAERNLILMVGHNRYYLPHLQRLIEIVKSGKLGKILSVEANYLNPPQKNDLTHTALEGLGYHLIYMINALLGRDHPDELLAGATSKDWETVGIKLRYDDIPVTVKLDRNYDKTKTRNIIVRGSNFTATFDYTKEAIQTELSFEPTHKEFEEGSVSYDPLVLKELQKSIPLSQEDARPSLHHQLKVFLEAIRTETKPPSNGESAISVVETLEQIRNKLKASDFYLSKSYVSDLDLIRLARLIHERVGKNGGIVDIDGSSGVGKSTFTETLRDVYELMYPSARGVIDPLDELLLPWEVRSVVKKKILGEELNAKEIDILHKYGWEHITDEKLTWNNQAIILHLKHLRRLFDSKDDEGQIDLVNKQAYIKVQDRRFTTDTHRTVHHGDVVFVEGKYANQEAWAGLADVHVRLQAPARRIRSQFKEERAHYLSPQDLRAHMHYYDWFTWPSWRRYEGKTRGLIDLRINEKPMQARSDSRIIVKVSGPGGIDFNPDKINLLIKNNGGAIKFKIDPVMLKQLQNAPGFVPVIINVKPLTSLSLFLGINPGKEEDSIK